MDKSSSLNSISPPRTERLLPLKVPFEPLGLVPIFETTTCESFLKTLKYEEVYQQDYRDLAEARTSIEHFIEQVYNEKRLHSALGYLPPVEFERSLGLSPDATAGLLPTASPVPEFAG